jgi:hypothetical protein
MGFDVDAFAPDHRCVSRDPTLSAAFAAASEWVSGATGGVDGFLSLGSLDCGQAIDYLSRGLGRVCDPAAGIWPPDDVQAMAAAAQWPAPESVPPDEMWAYWSARRFLDVCVEQGLGIWFS